MLVWLGVFAVVGLYAIRGVAWWGLAIVPVVAALVAAGETASRPVPIGTLLMQRLNLILAALLVAVAVGFVPIWRPVDPATGAPIGLLTDAPPGVTAAVTSSAHAGDHLFAPQPLGSWFEFATPDLPVAVDSRIELFPGTVWADYDSVESGQGDWQGVLTRWHVAFVVVGAHDTAFEGRLVAAGWTSVYAGDDGSVFSAPAR
jgi:hypothetical protein